MQKVALMALKMPVIVRTSLNTQVQSHCRSWHAISRGLLLDTLPPAGGAIISAASICRFVIPSRYCPLPEMVIEQPPVGVTAATVAE